MRLRSVLLIAGSIALLVVALYFVAILNTNA
jgi:hypothetical protein